MKLLEKVQNHIQLLESKYFYIERGASYNKMSLRPGALHRDMYDPQFETSIEVVMDPSSNELSSLLKESQKGVLRGLMLLKAYRDLPYLDHTYFWDGSEAIHYEVEKKLLNGNNFTLPLIVGPGRNLLNSDDLIAEILDGDTDEWAPQAKAYARILQNLSQTLGIKFSSDAKRVIANWSLGLTSDGHIIEDDDD